MTRAEVVKHLVAASDEHSYSNQILRDRILDELESLGLVKFDPPIDREAREAQRKSWFIGETMLEHPEMTREQAELLYDHALLPPRS